MAEAGGLKSKLRVRVATPQNTVVELEGIEACYVPTADGVIGILPDHAQLMAELGTGILRTESGGQMNLYVVSGGLLEVQNNEVMVLADVGEAGVQIDLKRAQESLERARKRISLELDTGELLDLQRAFLAEKRALARIAVVEGKQD